MTREDDVWPQTLEQDQPGLQNKGMCYEGPNNAFRPGLSAVLKALQSLLKSERLQSVRRKEWFTARLLLVLNKEAQQENIFNSDS